MKKLKMLLAVTLVMILSLSAFAFTGCTPEDPSQPVAETAPAPVENDEEAPAPVEEDEEEDVVLMPEGDEVQTLEGEGDVTVRLTWIGGGQNRDALYQNLIPFTEETGIGVELIFIDGNWAEYFTRIQTMIAGGDSPDVAMVAIEGFEMIVDLGIALPMDEWLAANQDLAAPIIADISPNIMDIMNFNGRQYGVPNEWNNVVTHINTALLEEAGLDMPPADWGLDMFLEYAGALTRDLPDGTRQFGVFVPGFNFAIQAFMYNNGVSILSEDMTQSNLLDPAVEEIFQLFYDLVHVYEYAPIPEPGIEVFQLFMNGQIAMHFAGRWPTNAYFANDFEDVAIQYIPNFVTNVPIWGGTGAFTLADTAHPDEAQLLSLYLASPEFIEGFMQAGAIPTLNSVAETLVPALGIPGNYEIFIESAAMARPVQAPPRYAEMSQLVGRVFQDIVVNRQDIREILEAADAEMNLILMD